ncbi:LIM domain only protein 7 isoform X2 [Electrophorus electricus]|uniref:LIM domain only protein 7 isoform X2 n=1 Tax=Electrophorus electricus TaxID=8005 RepID=UPI0015CFAD8F|nr:LIM domain only protein 7 isoform X2 [Electrophorus electricus]
MEWREKCVSECTAACLETQRWMEAVTKKRFGSSNFRISLQNGMLLCDLVNKIKPGIIKRLNRLSTPIAGLDNVNVFLRACARLGLKEAQLFHPGDLQDLSTRVTSKQRETSRRLRNVLITIYWLGKKAQVDPLYNGPHLNLTAFQGLIGTAPHKASEDCPPAPSSDGDSGFGHSWYSDRQELFPIPGRHKREDSLDSWDSLSSKARGTSSDTTLKDSSEGCGSDSEAEQRFRMSENYRRSQVIAPKAVSQFNQFLPSKDKTTSGYVPAPLRRKRAERNDDNRRSWASPIYTEEGGAFTRGDQTDKGPSPVSTPAAHHAWVSEYESSDSDADRPDPDLVLDDLASRRFHNRSPAAPPNFAIPMRSVASTRGAKTLGPLVTVTNVPQQTLTSLSGEFRPVRTSIGRPEGTDVCLYDSGEEEDDMGCADPVHDDLYTRKVGLVAQPPAMMSYDKFLPKFWTPEEDVHVQKIKTGSQRRPWYRKIQGFSRKSPGSSSEDSDSDVSPWLCASSCACSQSEPPPSQPHAPDGSAGASLPTTPSPPAQQTTAPLRFDLPDFWPHPNPASGPKLIKCERFPLRGREHPMDPYNVSADILPDLENDDMFTRRMAAFHTSAELAWLKYGGLLQSRHASEPCIRVVIPKRFGQPIYPDIERDDVLYRRVQQQSVQRPPLGAPDSYHPVPIPDPGALPPHLQAKMHCTPYCPMWEEPEEGQRQREEHPKEDDMLVRKLRVGPIQGVRKPTGACLTSGSTQMGPAIPPARCEEDLRKWQAIREASRLRYKKRLMVERLLQKDSTGDGTKSMSDILAEQNELRKVHYEELQQIRTQVKETDNKWQDDLTKWKNRRRSVNSDIMKKKEEREQIENLTASSSTRRTKTFKEMEEEREGRGPGSFKSSFSTSEDQDVFEELTPRTRKLPSRSYTIDNPYALSGDLAARSEVPQRQEEPSSSESDDAGSPPSPVPSSQDRSSSRQQSQDSITSSRSLLDNSLPTLSISRSRQAEPTSSVVSHTAPEPTKRVFSHTTPENTNSEFSHTAPEPTKGVVSRTAPEPTGDEFSCTTPEPTKRVVSRTAPEPTGDEFSCTAPEPTKRVVSRTAPDPTGDEFSRTAPEPTSRLRPAVPPMPELMQPDGRPQDQSPALFKPNLVDRKQEAAGQISASFPRTYQKSHSARLTTVVAPRPFGTQTTRISSLPRAPTVNDSHKRFNGETESSNRTAAPRRYPQLTKEDKALSQGSSAHSSDEDEKEEDELVAPAVQASSSAPHVSRVSAQPKVAVAPVSNTKQESYSDMRISLAQKPKSSHDFGFQTSWDSSGAHVKSIQPGSPAELCHLQVGDEILAVNGHKVADMSYEQWNGKMNEALQQGSLFMDIRRYGKNSSPVTYYNTNLDFTSHPATDAAVKSLDISSQPAKDLTSNGVHGAFQEPVTLRNKESEPISLKNLKRRSEFFEQGGTENATLDVPVPPLSTSSNRWSWDPEEERRRQEKWQKEQERLLQEKYRQDQEKMEEEFRKAQQAAVQEGTKQHEEEMRRLELHRHNMGLHSPLTPLRQDEMEASRVALQDQKEKRRREQEIRHLEEERRRMEQQGRLEEEKRKSEQQERIEVEKRKREQQERLEEEKRKREQQERLEEEKRKREQQERIEEERRRREQQERLEEEKRKREHQKQLEEEKKKREDEEHQQREDDGRKREQEAQRLQKKRKEEAQKRLDDVDIGYTNTFPELSYSHRIKSKSTPELDETGKTDIKVVSGVLGESSSIKDIQKKKEPLSQAELERQQIIQEMKKKTPLLTDRSWIRQNSAVTSTSSEAISMPMRRGESLDNLDTSRPSMRMSWAPGSTSSIPDYSKPHLAVSGSTYRGGLPGSATLPASQSLSSLRQAWSQPQHAPNTSTEPGRQTPPQNRSVSGKKICTYCQMPLGKGAAMIIESLGLCYHLPCFKCIECKSDLGGSHAGAEVRIRNKQLYCNSCYIRFKNAQPSAL